MALMSGLDGYTPCPFCGAMGSSEDHMLDNSDGACPDCQDAYGDTRGIVRVPYVCPWKCGDVWPHHEHYSILVRESVTGKLLGRLCPDGTTSRKVIYAAVLSYGTACKVAADINQQGDYRAKVVPL